MAENTLNKLIGMWPYFSAIAFLGTSGFLCLSGTVNLSGIYSHNILLTKL